ncbi:hypothetical protein C8A01DRAFT_46113 [Parachaetomium inaequale]|uniref:Uncharacterized protein n=1 Tax=Parachaetomium inaequale TaxID=2588326 RepID=A0AAN6PGQ6_9PEZI|nr:hypothetical protein C8A01DRAFT_46113 [Parachaetomium inaequale]
MDPFSIPIEPIRAPHYEIDPSLRTITRGSHDFPTDTDLRYIGYQYDWDRPFPFWHFLGRMVAKAVFDDTADLKQLNFVAMGRQEFIVYTSSSWRAAAAAQKAAGVIEVNFKKPQPGQPIEMTWAPARALFTDKIGECRSTNLTPPPPVGWKAH